MKMLNLWDVENINGISYVEDINELLELIKAGEVRMLKIQDRYESGAPHSNMFEEVFEKKGMGIIYTSYEHPILISSNPLLSNYINPQFFKEHEKEIKEAYQYYCVNIDKDYVSIPSFAYSEELEDALIAKGIKSITFQDVEISEKVKEKLNNNLIKAELIIDDDLVEISSDAIIGDYSVDQLSDTKSLLLSVSDLRKIDSSKLIYLKDNISIDVLSSDIEENEEESYKIVKDAISKLSKSGKRIDITFPIYSRSVFKKVFKGERFDNIDIIVTNDLYNYKYEEYLEEEQKLDKLVEPIVKANLSPLERYIAVYNLVKNFKPYKENPNQLEESRYIRYILNNEYMVCVGYAKLLEVLCDKVGIKVNDISVTVDVSYDEAARNEEPLVQEKIVEKGGHARCMVSIDDDKYGVHGIYVADPTWDNELSENRLNHALMTFSKIGTARRMIWFNTYEPILDIYNMDDFKAQFDYLLKKEMLDLRKRDHLYFGDYLSFAEEVKMDSDKRYKELMTNKVIILMAYRNVIKSVLKPMSCEEILKKYYDRADDCKSFEEFDELLTDLGNYLLARVNQPISNETLIQASVNGKAILKGLNEQERQEEYERTRKDLYDRELTSFPYQIEDPDNLGWKTR